MPHYIRNHKMGTVIYLDRRSMHETLTMVIDIAAVMLVKKRRKNVVEKLGRSCVFGADSK